MTIATVSMGNPTKPISTPKRIHNPTNPKVPLMVGLMLVGLCVIQCTSDSVNPLTARPGVAAADPLQASRDAAGLERLAKTDHIALLQHCLDNYGGKYADYTCTLTKQERIGGILGQEQESRVRFRGAPFSVAMIWVTNPGRCDRLLYVEGRNNNEMRVRPTSRLLQILVPEGVSRKPDDEEITRGTLRTPDQFGFERNLKSLLAVYQEARRSGDLREEFGGYYTLDGRDTLVLVRYLATQRKDYPGYKTVTYIDVKYLVPVLIEAYDWGTGDCLSRYIISDVKFDVGLTEADFTEESIGLKRN